MKTLLATLAITAMTAGTSLAGPFWGFFLGNRPVTVPYTQHCHSPRPMYVVGPQYYKVRGVSDYHRVRNYSDAPLIIQTSRGNYIQPRSW